MALKPLKERKHNFLRAVEIYGTSFFLLEKNTNQLKFAKIVHLVIQPLHKNITDRCKLGFITRWTIFFYSQQKYTS